MTSIKQLIESTLCHNFKIELSKGIYRENIDCQQHKLLSMIDIFEKSKEVELLNPSILILDYNDRIICNQHMKIVNNEKQTDSNTNYELHFFWDSTDSKKLSSCFFDKSISNIIYCSTFTYDQSIILDENFKLNDLINNIIKKYDLNNSQELINFDVIVHSLNFEKHTWIVNTPFR